MRPNCADMAVRRLLYLAVLLGCGIFYIAYGQWLAWLLLMVVVFLPWFSLLVSLPAMLTFRIRPGGQEALEMGENTELWLLGSCRLPMPPFRGQLMLHRSLHGDSSRYRQDMEPISAHCGGITVTVRKVRTFDYLGLISLPVWKKESLTLLVRPQPLPVPLPEDLHRHVSRGWTPKHGGGFSENHELRSYRPGDSLNQIHWKLSAKTGSLILREPVEPLRGQVLVTMHLRGTPEVLDRKFGRLLWLGKTLLEQELPFELRCLTGNGVLTYSIGDTDSLQKAMDTLLCQCPATQGDLRQQVFSVPWHYHIGGEPDDA